MINQIKLNEKKIINQIKLNEKKIINIFKNNKINKKGGFFTDIFKHKLNNWW